MVKREDTAVERVTGLRAQTGFQQEKEGASSWLFSVSDLLLSTAIWCIGVADRTTKSHTVHKRSSVALLLFQV